MPIPTNELNPADRAILESLRSQGDNINAQTRILRNLAENLSSQAREFRNLRKDFDATNKTAERGNRGISDLKKMLSNIFKAQGNTGTRVQMSGGAPDRGFFNNLFSKIFGPSKYQVKMQDDLSALRDSSERMGNDIRFIRSAYEEPARRRERQLLAQAIANIIDDNSKGDSGGSMLGGLAAGAGGALGGLFRGLGTVIGGALVALGPILAAAIGLMGPLLTRAITGLTSNLKDLFSRMFGGSPTGRNSGGIAPIPPTGNTPEGGTKPGEAPRQLPAPQGSDKGRMPNSSARPGYGGTGQPVEEVTPREVKGGRTTPTFDPGGARSILAKILKIAAVGLGISIGIGVGKDVVGEIGSDKTVDDVMNDIDKQMRTRKEKEALAQGATEESIKEQNKSLIQKELEEAEKAAQEKLKAAISQGTSMLESLVEGFADTISKEVKKGIDTFNSDYASKLDNIFKIKLNVPNAQGEEVEKELNLLPGLGSAFGEALTQSQKFYGELIDDVKEGANRVTNVVTNNTSVDQSSSGMSFPGQQPRNAAAAMEALHRHRYSIPTK